MEGGLEFAKKKQVQGEGRFSLKCEGADCRYEEFDRAISSYEYTFQRNGVTQYTTFWLFPK